MIVSAFEGAFAFTKQGTSNFFCSLYIAWNGDHQKLHCRFRDTILNREVPIEAIFEINEILLQLEEANNYYYYYYLFI